MSNRHGEEMYEADTTRVCTPTHFLKFQTGRGAVAIYIYMVCKQALLHIRSPTAPNSCSYFAESFVYVCPSVFLHTVFIYSPTDSRWPILRRNYHRLCRRHFSHDCLTGRVMCVLVAFLYSCVRFSSRGSKAVGPLTFNNLLLNSRGQLIQWTTIFVYVCGRARRCTRTRRPPLFPVTLLRHRGYTRLWAHCSASLSWTKTSVCFREGLASPPNICSCCWTPTVLRHGQMLRFSPSVVCPFLLWSSCTQLGN